MDTTARKGSPSQVIMGLSALFILVALLFPSAVPLLDHHYAERQFGHHHIYLGPVAVDHSHPYEQPHSHSQHAHPAADVGSDSEIGVGDGRIIYLPNEDSSSGTAQTVTHTVAPTLLVFVQPPADLLVLALARETGAPPEASVPPPEHPPKV